ncbi:MAG: hypothetical protein HN842_00110 [Gammaproteobacteria bacterium]|jgi:hypothetical protein|nr:hypothetical protein [Gammaproteobacteria bacterium]
MKQILRTALTVMTSAALMLGAMGLSTATQAAGPHVMVFSDDADKDTIKRGSRVFNRVLNELNSVLHSMGYNVYDEAAVSSKESMDGSGGYAQGRTRRSDVEILDIARSQKSPPVDVAVLFQVYASAKDMDYTTKINTRISGRMLAVQSGQFMGDFEVTNRFNGPADCNAECLKEIVGNNAKKLATDLGDALRIKLDEMSGMGSDSGSSLSSEGMKKGYTLNFSRFSSDERMRMEEFLVNIFSGYHHLRPTDCSSMHCTYWYESELSSAHLNRNLRRMLGEDEMNIKHHIKMSGNEFTIEKIATRQKRTTPRNSGW